ncbi:MAG: hypothetical protein GC180_00425 [Bacteroidetes bacterium]|nr:hypothetical protein [Bacteroidota bacterium]
MKRIISVPVTLAIISVCSFLISCEGKKEPVESNEPVVVEKRKTELIAANDAFYAGLNEMFKGNIEPLNEVWSHSDSISYMGPFGGALKGWTAIGKDFANVAAMRLGGKISCNYQNVYAGTEMGFVSCIEEGENIDPDGNPVKVSHRATNIYQVEDGKWRLVHHHTDISNQLETAYNKETPGME